MPFEKIAGKRPLNPGEALEWDADRAMWHAAQAEMRERCAEEFFRLWAGDIPFHHIGERLRALEIT